MRIRHRLSRLEQLEPRVVLDGSMTAGLAFVPSESPVTIPQPRASFFSLSNGQNSSSFDRISIVRLDEARRLSDDESVVDQPTSNEPDRIADEVLARPTFDIETPYLATSVPFVGPQPIDAILIPLLGAPQASGIIVAESTVVRTPLDRAESAADAIASRSQIAIAANPATNVNTDASGSSPMLSEHAYFKQATSRRSVNWSIQSAASESRSHGPTPDSSIDISHAAVSVVSGSIALGSNFFDRIEKLTCEVANSSSQLACFVAIEIGSTLRLNGMPNETPQLVALRPISPTSTDHSDNATPIEPVLSEPPISLLVGASLVSAYLIADRKIDDQKQRKRNGSIVAER